VRTENNQNPRACSGSINQTIEDIHQQYRDKKITLEEANAQIKTIEVREAMIFRISQKKVLNFRDKSFLRAVKMR
jgi:hypothetical protein